MMKNKIKKAVIGWVSVGCIVAVIILAVTFQDYLGARVIGAKGGRVSVRQGEVVSLQLPKTSAPSVKIELCQEGIKPAKCVLLINKTSEKKLDITIPSLAILGKANIKVTERNVKGAVTKKILMRRSLLVTKIKPTPAPTSQVVSNSSSGGGSEGSGRAMTSEEIQKYYPIVYAPVSISIDYNKSLENMIRDASYAKVDPFITSANFPLGGTGIVQTQVRLIRFGDPQCPGGSISTQNVLQEIAKLGFEPAKIEQVVAFERQNELASNYAYVALGSSWVNPQDGSRYIPDFFKYYGKEIGLRKMESSWSCSDAFWPVIQK